MRMYQTSSSSIACVVFFLSTICIALGQTCDPTPELTALAEWTSDLREAAQKADLNVIDTECPTNPRHQKVLMIGIDGLRADAVGMLPLPNFRRLERMGTYSYWAHVQKTATAVSGPGWGSLLTGVEPEKHGIDGNGSYEDLSYPTFLKVVKDKYPGKKVAASVYWDPLIEMIESSQHPITLDGKFIGSSDTAVEKKVIDWIKEGEYSVIFVDFDDVDATGHQNTFDGYAESYGSAVQDVDGRVGRILDAVLEVSKGQEWLIVITSDHGGKRDSHGGKDTYNRRVPFLVASNSPRVNIGTMPVTDPGSQMDVLPTIMHFFGGKSAIPAGLDGQVFGFRDYIRKGCNKDPDNCGCRDIRQADYRGKIAVTEEGSTCQKWSSQTPNKHSRTPEEFPHSGLDENYCRNPDGEKRAWCYTIDGARWEYCSVPDCPDTTQFPTAAPAPTESPTTSQNVCKGLSKNACNQKNDVCTYGPNKIFTSCAPKQKYEEDCARHLTKNTCLFGNRAELCKYKDGVCSHRCNGLTKKACTKLKDNADATMCTREMESNPCKKCNLKTMCPR